MDKTADDPAKTCLRSEGRARSVSVPSMMNARTYCLYKSGSDADCQCISGVHKITFSDKQHCSKLEHYFMSYRWKQADESVSPSP